MAVTSAFAEKPNYGSFGDNYDFGLAEYGIGNRGSGVPYISAGRTQASTRDYTKLPHYSGAGAKGGAEDGDGGFKWDGDALAGAAGLGSVALELVALPDQLKLARLQQKGLKQNIEFAKQEQTRRNNNIASFNSARPSQPTSAFANQGAE